MKKSKLSSQACMSSIKKNELLKNDAIKKLKILNESFFSSQSIIELKNTINYQYSTFYYIDQITNNEIYNVIMKSNSYKILNNSNIFNVILQQLMHQFFSTFLRLFNKCYNLNYCFKTFKNFITIVFKKSNNDNIEKFRDYHEIKLYQLITLLKTLNKTLKSIIARKITYITKKHDLLFESYIKNRRCKSTKHVIHALMKKIITI